MYMFNIYYLKKNYQNKHNIKQSQYFKIDNKRYTKYKLKTRNHNTKSGNNVFIFDTYEINILMYKLKNKIMKMKLRNFAKSSRKVEINT